MCIVIVLYLAACILVLTKHTYYAVDAISSYKYVTLVANIANN